jgi:polar amino acid transport system permease protein
VKIAYPALASQIVILLLGSSIVSAISATELTAITNSLQSQTFRAFEFYFAAAAIYLALALTVKGALGSVYWLVFVRGRER